jgi:hypothetical protein
VGYDESGDSNATLERAALTARNAATVTRLLAAHPPCCPLVRAALARVLAQTLAAWSSGFEPFVRPRAPARRTREPALRRAHTDQPRTGEGR